MYEEFIFPTISLIITIITIIIGYVTRIVKMEKDISELKENAKKYEACVNDLKAEFNKLKERFEASSVKTDLFWSAIEKELINILHHPIYPERDVLLEKFADKSITIAEMEKLKELLEEVIAKKSPKDEVVAAILFIGRINILIQENNRIKGMVDSNEQLCRF